MWYFTLWRDSLSPQTRDKIMEKLLWQPRLPFKVFRFFLVEVALGPNF